MYITKHLCVQSCSGFTNPKPSWDLKWSLGFLRFSSVTGSHRQHLDISYSKLRCITMASCFATFFGSAPLTEPGPWGRGSGAALGVGSNRSAMMEGHGFFRAAHGIFYILVRWTPLFLYTFGCYVPYTLGIIAVLLWTYMILHAWNPHPNGHLAN